MKQGTVHVVAVGATNLARRFAAAACLPFFASVLSSSDGLAINFPRIGQRPRIAANRTAD